MSKMLHYPAGDSAGLFEDVNIGYKVWLEKNDSAFGEGLFDLLQFVDRYGSISRAANAMDMSYRAAWGKIKSFEKQWSKTLVFTRVGGETGGGAVLTRDAKKLVECYECLNSNVQTAVDSFFRQCFQD